MSHQFINKRITLRTLTISLDDVRRIFERLLKQVEEEAERQTKELVRPPGQTPEEFTNQIAAARKKAFRITITITGSQGDDLFGDSLALFDSPNLPDEIRTIYMTNEVAYKSQTGSSPTHGFSLTLDFAKPPLIDNNNPLSNPTANGINLAIEGQRDSWVSAVTDAVMGILNNRKNGRSFIHSAFVYDVGLMSVGLPLGLYLCWRISGFIDSNLARHSHFLSAVAYLYIVLIGIWAYRIMFGYSKWAFPTLELKENEGQSTKHRYIWGAILLCILGNAAYELSKAALI
jgi:hypothetical protein